MDMTDAFMRTLIFALFFVVVIVFTLRKIREVYPDTGFAWFKSSSEYISLFAWAGRTVWRRRWLVLLPCGLLLTTRSVQIYAKILARRRILETYGYIPEWWVIKDAFMRTLPLRMPYILTDSARELPSGIVGVFGVGAILILLLTLVAIVLRGRVAGELVYYAGQDGAGGVAFLKKFLGVVRIAIITAIVVLIAAAFAGAGDMTVIVGCLVMLILAVACGAFFVLLGGFVLSYLKQVWAGKEPSRSAALAESLIILPSLLVVRIIISLVTKPDVIAAFPLSLYTWFGVTEASGYPAVMKVGYLIGLHYRYPPAVISLLLVCVSFPLVIGARSPWQTLLWNFQFIGKYLVRYLALVATGLAALFGIKLASLILLTMVNDLTYPGMVLEIVLDWLFLAAGLLFYLACFKFFMDRHGGRSVVSVE